MNWYYFLKNKYVTPIIAAATNSEMAICNLEMPAIYADGMSFAKVENKKTSALSRIPIPFGIGTIRIPIIMANA